MNNPLMPKATAVWLIENTALTFDQIAAFCGLHELEVQSIAGPRARATPRSRAGRTSRMRSPGWCATAPTSRTARFPS